MATSPISASPAAAGTAPPTRAALSIRPFFENRARAFWTLQAAGWSGYLLLRGVSASSNHPSLEVIVPVIIESIVGYCITLLLSTLYGYYRGLRRITGIPLTVATLLVATLLYAALDAFSFSFITLANPGLDLSLMLGEVYWARNHREEALGWFHRHLRDMPESKAREAIARKEAEFAPAGH